MKPIPLLIFSDAVSAPTGLARITRDLANRIAANLQDVFRVATIGYGGAGTSKCNFPQYNWAQNGEWIIRDLPEVWDDFAGDQRGIFMSIHDPARMLWFARPETCSDARIRKFMENPPFKKWGYFPIDATGPNNKLSCMLRECLIGYDRVLCYSEWARAIVENTLGEEKSKNCDLDQLPHGIDTKVFYPRDKNYQREQFGKMAVGQEVSIATDELLVGIVATNQARKDWGLGIATVAELAKERKVRLWAHIDVLDRYWSLPYLLADFGLTKTPNIITVGHFSDDMMAKLYSACDVTLGIGVAEGFGLPIFESLACGSPCFHCDYGGAAEHLEYGLKIPPTAWRTDGVFNCVRPVMSAEEWVYKMNLWTGKVRLPDHLDWNNLWPRWDSWFRRGIA